VTYALVKVCTWHAPQCSWTTPATCLGRQTSAMHYLQYNVTVESSLTITAESLLDFKNGGVVSQFIRLLIYYVLRV